MDDIIIRPATIKDAESITEIYNYYIKNTVITFEEVALNPSEMTIRIDSAIKNYSFLVAVKDDKIIGYAYTSQFGSRSAYKFTAYISVYLDIKFIGSGAGSLLYKDIIEISHKQNLKTLVALLVSGNSVSVKFHDKFKFKKVGYLESAGFKFDKWLDIEYRQLLLY